MRLRTDDDIYRARLTYLGPPGYTFPVHLQYGQYALFAVLVPLFMVIHSLVMWRPPDLLPAYEIALAMVATSWIFKHVDHDRPAKQVIRTAFTDWRRSKVGDTEVRDPAFRGRHIRIRKEIV